MDTPAAREKGVMSAEGSVASVAGAGTGAGAGAGGGTGCSATSRKAFTRFVISGMSACMGVTVESLLSTGTGLGWGVGWEGMTGG